MEYNKQTHPLLDPCSPSCRQHCAPKYTRDERSQINSDFWSLSFERRRLWFDGYIVISPVAQRKVQGQTFVKNNSASYHLPKENTKIKVYKTVFLHTLGMKTDRMVFDFIKAKTQYSEEVLRSVLVDRRGSTTPSNKKDHKTIKEHIHSYNPQVSHYRLEHAPNRRYLEPYLTIKDMWNDYIEKHEKFSYYTYRNVFSQENIGFGHPSQDDCDVCATFDAHKSTISDNEHDESSCSECATGKAHLDRARNARKEYQSENERADVDIFTADMQKVILLSKMTTKEHFFISRLVVFNETFANVNGTNDMVVLWHEAIAGRLGCNVASSYIKCVSMSGKPHIIFWADNCTAQNKNWTLFTALCWCVNQEWGPNSIVIKYFEKGHTFMRADSVHGKIGTKMGKTPNVYNFEDFVQLCNSSAKCIKPTCMEVDDFYQFADGHCSRQSKKVKVPQLSQIYVVEFKKGSRSMWYKENFAAEPVEVDFLKPKFKIDEVTKLERPRGLKRSKKEGILKLVTSFPSAKKKFWLEMPESDASVDLVHDFE